MGDRTYCTLSVFGEIDRAGFTKLAYRIGAEWDGTQLEPDDHPGEFGFEGVNYGQIDDDLCAELEAAGLSYAWHWQAGGGYGDGVYFVDRSSEAVVSAEFACSQGGIVLSLRDANDPETVGDANGWECWWRDTKLAIIGSGPRPMLAADIMLGAGVDIAVAA